MKTSIDAVKKSPQSSDSPPTAPSIENGGHNSISIATNLEETHKEEDPGQKTDNNENAEISVTRTSINNELLGVASGGGVSNDSVPVTSESTASAPSNTSDRLLRTKQLHRGASADVLTPDDASLSKETPRSRSDESIS